MLAQQQMIFRALKPRPESYRGAPSGFRPPSKNFGSNAKIVSNNVSNTRSRRPRFCLRSTESPRFVDITTITKMDASCTRIGRRSGHIAPWTMTIVISAWKKGTWPRIVPSTRHSLATSRTNEWITDSQNNSKDGAKKAIATHYTSGIKMCKLY